MQSGVRLDLAGALPFIGGARALASRATRVAEARGRCERGPAPADPDPVALDVIAGKQLRIAARPGLLDTLRAPLIAAGLAPVEWVHGPGEPLRATHALVGFEGPLWIDAEAEAAVALKRRVVMAGDGEHAAPPKGAWIADPFANDARWCLHGPTFATLMARLGAPDWQDGVAEAQADGERPALVENLVWSLACALAALPGRKVQMVVTAPELLPFAEAVSRSWGALVRGSPRGLAVVRPETLTVVPWVLGDVERFEAMCFHADDALIFVLGPPADEVRTLTRWASGQRIPLISLRVPGLSPRLVAYVWSLLTEAALALVALKDLSVASDVGAVAWARAAQD